MANTVLTTSAIARRALAVLSEGSVLARTVARDFDSEFVAGRGATVNVRRLTSGFTAQEFDGTAVTIQDVTEGSLPVTLDKHLDVSFEITTQDLALNIEDFQTQILEPAMIAMIEGVDAQVAAALLANSAAEVGDDIQDAGAFIQARKALNVAKIPMSGRIAALSNDHAAEMLELDVFTHADKSGSPAGLREASLGRVRGFDTFETTHISQSVAYHPDAVVLAARPLPAPMGASSDNVQIVNYDGFSLRVVMDYNQSLKKDVVSIDCLVGTAPLRGTAAAVKLSDNAPA